MKFCNTCKETKEITAFAKKGNSLQAMCKACRKTWFAQHYKNNKKYYLERNKRQDEINRLWFKEYKATLSCTKCGENDPVCLDFHHTDSSTKDLTVSEAIRYSKNKAFKELAKCIVLCANCHRKHHSAEKSS